MRFCVSLIVLIQYGRDKNFYSFVKITLQRRSAIWARDEHEGKEKSLSLDAHIPGVPLYGPHLRALHPVGISAGSGSSLAACWHPYIPSSNGVTCEHSFWEQEGETFISFFTPCALSFSPLPMHLGCAEGSFWPLFKALSTLSDSETFPRVTLLFGNSYIGFRTKDPFG